MLPYLPFAMPPGIPGWERNVIALSSLPGARTRPRALCKQADGSKSPVESNIAIASTSVSSGQRVCLGSQTAAATVPAPRLLITGSSRHRNVSTPATHRRICPRWLWLACGFQNTSALAVPAEMAVCDRERRIVPEWRGLAPVPPGGGCFTAGFEPPRSRDRVRELWPIWRFRRQPPCVTERDASARNGGVWRR